MKKYLFTLVLLSLIGRVFAQETNDIGTETVTVTKSYSPTVSDAFKIKLSPKMNDSIVLQKKPITYSIFSVPVASTFTPAKGKAATVEKTPPPTLYNSYASIGLGNFNNALVDFYTSREINRREDFFDVGLTHHSSRGDIATTPLETNFYNTDLDVSYTKRTRDLDWGASVGLEHKLYNWYGLESGAFTQDQVLAIDETQNYFMGQAKAHLNLEDSPFTGGELVLRRFWDATESFENRAIISPSAELPIAEEWITIDGRLDYVGGTFKNSNLNQTQNTGENSYGFAQFALNPSILILRNELSVNLGANFVYGMDLENNNGNFYIYPAITASYRLVDETVIAYGGLEGDLHQNSYYELVGDNPYVSPTLLIQPTDTQYNGYVGLKGQLLPNLGYNVKASYVTENRKPLFLLNPQNLFRSEEGYAYGNSFQVFYDDLKTIGFFGELNVDVNRDFTLGLNAEFYSFNTETDNPAWNLPQLKGSLFMDYQIGKQWFFGANLFYVGEREDLRAIVIESVLPNEFPSETVTLEGFFDANAHLGYRFNDQLSIFARMSNIANNNYQRWYNFRVQGFQALAGASYKFDF
ncbi:TonB-dependent receptor [Croceivirga thetidis]|uniref:TonB-dependent receptor n=1 Tax=Croceivirga thetidis TaxID=2721623 RepID=A0ABX1GW57_9FLAO|nr:TonB-dependent receptor [Croceivirga thetidis]NKI33120.1 TonB-dependent receptor [Croceivirga thetidis]